MRHLCKPKGGVGDGIMAKIMSKRGESEAKRKDECSEMRGGKKSRKAQQNRPLDVMRCGGLERSRLVERRSNFSANHRSPGLRKDLLASNREKKNTLATDEESRNDRSSDVIDNFHVSPPAREEGSMPVSEIALLSGNEKELMSVCKRYPLSVSEMTDRQLSELFGMVEVPRHAPFINNPVGGHVSPGERGESEEVNIKTKGKSIIEKKGVGGDCNVERGRDCEKVMEANYLKQLQLVRLENVEARRVLAKQKQNEEGELESWVDMSMTDSGHTQTSCKGKKESRKLKMKPHLPQCEYLEVDFGATKVLSKKKEGLDKEVGQYTFDTDTAVPKLRETVEGKQKGNLANMHNNTIGKQEQSQEIKVKVEDYADKIAEHSSELLIDQLKKKKCAISQAYSTYYSVQEFHGHSESHQKKKTQSFTDKVFPLYCNVNQENTNSDVLEKRFHEDNLLNFKLEDNQQDMICLNYLEVNDDITGNITEQEKLGGSKTCTEKIDAQLFIDIGVEERFEDKENEEQNELEELQDLEQLYKLHTISEEEESWGLTRTLTREMHNVTDDMKIANIVTREAEMWENDTEDTDIRAKESEKFKTEADDSDGDFVYAKGTDTLEFEILEQRINSDMKEGEHSDEGCFVLGMRPTHRYNSNSGNKDNLKDQRDLLRTCSEHCLEEYAKCGIKGDKEPNHLDEEGEMWHLDEEGEMWHLDEEGEMWHLDEEGEKVTTMEADLTSWLEAERSALGRLLGEEKLLSLYRAVTSMAGEEDKELQEGWGEVCGLLGSGGQHLVDRVIQLVVADSHYVLSN